MITILNSTVNITGREHIWLFNEHEKLHFDNEWDIYMRSQHYEVSAYNFDMDLATISS